MFRFVSPYLFFKSIINLLVTQAPYGNNIYEKYRKNKLVNLEISFLSAYRRRFEKVIGKRKTTY